MSIADSALLNSYERKYLNGGWTSASLVGGPLASIIVFEKLGDTVQVTIADSGLGQITGAADILTYSLAVPLELRPAATVQSVINVNCNSTVAEFAILGAVQISSAGAITASAATAITILSTSYIAMIRNFAVNAYVGIPNVTFTYSLNP